MMNDLDVTGQTFWFASAKVWHCSPRILGIIAHHHVPSRFHVIRDFRFPSSRLIEVFHNRSFPL